MATKNSKVLSRELVDEAAYVLARAKDRDHLRADWQKVIADLYINNETDGIAAICAIENKFPNDPEAQQEAARLFHAQKTKLPDMDAATRSDRQSEAYKRVTDARARSVHAHPKPPKRTYNEILSGAIVNKESRGR